MKNNSSWFGCLFATLTTMAQTEHTFQVISLILTIIATTITIAFTVYKWYKISKEDGVIDIDEAKQLTDILIDGAEEIKKEINDYQGDKDGSSK